MTSSTEQTETIPDTSGMDVSTDNISTNNNEEKSSNGIDEEPSAIENKAGKRKRSSKKGIETDETMNNLPNGRPKRNLSKRDEVPTNMMNGNGKVNKSKTERNSIEQAGGDADDEQERDKNLPIVYDVSDVVWVKMGGHPWWPSLIVRDPNDSTQCFTKISGTTRAKRMYFVVFYGSTADFAWVSDAAVIPYKGVEAFTKYAQETVDKAQTKSQKEQLTERFQLKVTIGRREDWERAVREADDSLKQTNETRLQEIEPKVQFYTTKLVTPKGQPGRRPKISVTKPEEPSEPTETSTSDPADRSSLAEKTFEFKSDDDESSVEAPPVRKPSLLKIKLKKQTLNGSDSNSSPSPPPKRPYILPKLEEKQSSIPPVTTIFGQTANGSSVSYQQRAPPTNNVTTPIKSNPTNIVNGTSSGKKRGRPRLKPLSPASSNEDSPAPEFNSASPTVTTKFTTQRKPITKPQAFTNNLFSGQHDIRTGFLSPFEEQEVLDALGQLRSTKTFEEAEQEAKRRFEHILCLNLNRTHVDIPQEWFYTFLFSHPSLIMKNPQWFTEKTNSADTFNNDNDFLNDVNSSSSLAVLKHQLVVLSKLYRNELQIRQSAPVKKRRSTGGSVGKQKLIETKTESDDNIPDQAEEEDEEEEEEEELVN